MARYWGKLSFTYLCLALPCLALHPLPLSSLYLAISFSYSCTIRNELQGELLEPEEAFDMLIASHQSNFRPMYGDSDVLTLSSFDGFEITKQVNITVNYIKFNLIESNWIESNRIELNWVESNWIELNFTLLYCDVLCELTIISFCQVCMLYIFTHLFYVKTHVWYEEFAALFDI